jgi:hypothetical protein
MAPRPGSKAALGIPAKEVRKRGPVAKKKKRRAVMPRVASSAPSVDYVLALQNTVSVQRKRLAAAEKVVDFLVGLACSDEKGRNDSREIARLCAAAEAAGAPCPMCWSDDHLCECGKPARAHGHAAVLPL